MREFVVTIVSLILSAFVYMGIALLAKCAGEGIVGHELASVWYWYAGVWVIVLLVNLLKK